MSLCYIPPIWWNILWTDWWCSYGITTCSNSSQQLYEKFKQEALSTALRKPTHWYIYIDDIFVIWPHGRERHQDFLHHLKGIHWNISSPWNITISGCFGKGKYRWHPGPHGIQENDKHRLISTCGLRASSGTNKSSPFHSHPPCMNYLW